MVGTAASLTTCDPAALMYLQYIATRCSPQLVNNKTWSKTSIK